MGFLKKNWAIVVAVVMFVLGTGVLLIDGLGLADIDGLVKTIAGALQAAGGLIAAIKAVIDKLKSGGDGAEEKSGS